jgi:hypothetical protein
MSTIVSILIRPVGQRERREAPMAIIDLSHSYVSGRSWKVATGTQSGLGAISPGKWTTKKQPTWYEASTEIAIDIFDINGKMFMSLWRAPDVDADFVNPLGRGSLYFSNGGTLPIGEIDWRLLGTASSVFL